MTAVREAAIDAIRELPDEASLDDIVEEIIYYAKIEEGLRDADAGRLIPVEDVQAEFAAKR